MRKILVVLGVLLLATPAFAQLQYQQPAPYQSPPQAQTMGQPHNADDWYNANHQRPTQQERNQDQWQHSSAPNVVGGMYGPPDNARHPDQEEF